MENEFGGKPRTRQGRILHKRFFRSVFLLTREQQAWLNDHAAKAESSAGAVLRAILKNLMETEK